MSPHYIRRRRTEVLTQLPKRNDAPIYLNMADEQREIHETLASRVARLVGIFGKRPLTQAEHLQLMQLLNQMRIVCNGLAQFNFEQKMDDEAKIDDPVNFGSDDVNTEGVSVQATHPVDQPQQQNQKLEQKNEQIQKMNLPQAFNLREVMKELHITRDRDSLKIEAKGDSARLLADVFRSMADLFSPLDS